MMDINCPKCGEPWDMDELHEMYLYDDKGIGHAVKLSFEEARKRFYKDGCEAFGSKHNDTPDKAVAMKSAALMGLLGDDVDGLAAMMQDL